MLSKRLIMTALCGVLATSATALAHDLELTGVIRDFKRGDKTGGHPDFETASKSGRGGFGLVSGMVTFDLCEEGKPVYNPTRPSKDTIWSAESLAQWYRDVPGVNLSTPWTITLTNGKDTPGGIYSYSNNKFFPIDGQFFGNEGSKDASGKERNFHFTFELRNKFNYRTGQKFTFIGDDDVWVYVNGKKVIDIGGVHPAATANVLLFDGKAFVTKAQFPVGGIVKSVTSSMANTLATKWTSLGLEGTCPIKSGDPYIDLNLNNGKADVLPTFNGTSVTVKASADLSNAVLKFADGLTQKFDGLSGTSKTFTGTGAYAGKTIAGVWVKTGPNQSGDSPGYGTYYGADGSGGTECTLDFFFAERHQTESNFRIDTSINLQPKPITTVSPLYD